MSLVNVKNPSVHTEDVTLINNGGAVILGGRANTANTWVGTSHTETPGELDFCGINKDIIESNIT